MMGFLIEGGTEEALSGLIGDDRYLATTPLREVNGVYPLADGLSNLQIREIGAKEAIRFGESATDFTSMAYLGWHNLRLKNHGDVFPHLGRLQSSITDRLHVSQPFFLV